MKLLSMPAEQYHSAEGVSRSMLEYLQPPFTPYHYRAKFITKEMEDEETPAMKLGTLTHRAILEPDTMDGAFYVRPEGMKFTTKEGKAWLEEHEDREVLSTDQASRIKGMRDAVWRHPLLSKLLKLSDFERSAFVEEKGLTLKSRFDALPRGSNAIVDIKTCESASLDKVERNIADFGYWRQAAFYLKVANLCGLDRELFLFGFVEKNPPYAVAVYQLADDVVEAGRMTIERDLQVLRNCVEKNEWPGFGFGILTAGLPAYLMKQLEGMV